MPLKFSTGIRRVPYVYPSVYNFLMFETTSKFSVLRSLNQLKQFSENTMCFIDFVLEMLIRTDDE